MHYNWIVNVLSIISAVVVDKDFCGIVLVDETLSGGVEDDGLRGLVEHELVGWTVVKVTDMAGNLTKMFLLSLS